MKSFLIRELIIIQKMNSYTVINMIFISLMVNHVFSQTCF